MLQHGARMSSWEDRGGRSPHAEDAWCTLVKNLPLTASTYTHPQMFAMKKKMADDKKKKKELRDKEKKVADAAKAAAKEAGAAAPAAAADAPTAAEVPAV